jgi:hypothetical protein
MMAGYSPLVEEVLYWGIVVFQCNKYMVGTNSLGMFESKNNKYLFYGIEYLPPKLGLQSCH